MTYKEALTYLNALINYENFVSFDYKNSFKLDRMRQFADMLGNPQHDLRCIHIAGTKGKGSTSVMVASILKEAGLKVGLYTSPHLISFRERIRINDEFISEEDLCSLLARIKRVIERRDKKEDMPTFFEVYTAMAFLYFKEKKADLCVLEVGLGGRLDATNIIERPLCCGITQISFEHTQKLGNTLREIAREKAGIIKEGSLCVASSQEDSVSEVVRETCKIKNAKLCEVGKDISFQEEGIGTFSVSGMFGKYPFLGSGLLGDHQFMNAATAIGLVESLRVYDIIIPASAVRGGIRKVDWPGRLQILQRSPLVVLDGAQNRASAKALREAIKKYFDYNKLILVLGISKDKDIKGICEELEPITDEVILTKANLPRAEEPEVIKRFLKRDPMVSSGVKEAMDVAMAAAGPADLILATGSLFVVGEILRHAMHLCKN